MQEILIPSLVGALIAISWYWLMELLPPFRAARRAAMAEAATPAGSEPVPERAPAMPAQEVLPNLESIETARQFTEMLTSALVTLALAKRQGASRIGILETGKASNDAIFAVKNAVGPDHEVVLVSADEATKDPFDILISVGIHRGALPESVWKVYNWGLRLEDPAQNVRIAVGTPKG